MSIVFFQAEDGIRDFHVTGVQTCALPISESCLPHASTSSPLQNPTLLEDPRCRQLKPIRPAQPPCIHEGAREVGTVPQGLQQRTASSEQGAPIEQPLHTCRKSDAQREITRDRYIKNLNHRSRLPESAPLARNAGRAPS